MDRNTLLAFSLAFVVIALWMSAQPPPAPRDAPPGEETEATQEMGAIPEWQVEPGAGESEFADDPFAESPRQSVGETARVPEKIVVVETELFRAELTSRGAGLARWDLAEYRDASQPGTPPVSLVNFDPGMPAAFATPFRELGIGDLSQADFSVDQPDPLTVAFRYAQGGVELRKTFFFEADRYVFRTRIEVDNNSGASLFPIFEAVWPAAPREGVDYEEQSLSVYQDGSLERMWVGDSRAAMGAPGGCGGGEISLEEFVGDVEWAGAQTRYFLAAMVPEVSERASAHVLPLGEKQGLVSLAQRRIELRAGTSHSYEYRAYVGPKERERLGDPSLARTNLNAALNVGWSWVAPIARFFGWLMHSFYAYIPNYGWVIILVTILVRVLMAPMMQRQMRSMKKMSTQMAALKPKLDEVKEKYAEDRQQQQQEMMKVYREAGVNPLGMLSGCLPLLLQMPVFIGMFYALQGAIELRQAPFISWINDLSRPEVLFVIPGLGLPFRVLPLVMGASMWLQQRLTPTASMDPAQARMMNTVMPVMFTFLFYQFPSGLVLYWLVSNLLAIAQQLFVNRGLAREAGAS